MPTNAAIDATCAGLYQGDVLDASIDLIGHRFRRSRLLLERGQGRQAVMLTHTCDLRRSVDQRPYAVVAPVVTLEDADAKSAMRLERPRYVPVPALAPTGFADLDRATTVRRSALVDLPVTRGCNSDDDRRRFGRSVGRYYSRFAFPDELAIATSRLVRRIKERHDRASSSEGAILNLLDEIRVEASPSWTADDVDVTVYFVVTAGKLPVLAPDDPPPAPSDETRDWFDSRRRSSVDLATRLESSSSDGDIGWLWERLAEAWVDLCTPTQPLNSFRGVAVAIEEFSMLDYKHRTDQLDLEYLTDRSQPKSAR